MKNCPLSSEGSFFEDYGCLFANLSAYHLERYFSKVQKRPLLAAYLLERYFLQTLYNSRIFVLLDEVMKYFFDFVAVFSHSRRLPLEGINL
jgi:hypothetical protein